MTPEQLAEVRQTATWSKSGRLLLEHIDEQQKALDRSWTCEHAAREHLEHVLHHLGPERADEPKVVTTAREALANATAFGVLGADFLETQTIARIAERELPLLDRLAEQAKALALAEALLPPLRTAEEVAEDEQIRRDLEECLMGLWREETEDEPTLWDLHREMAAADQRSPWDGPRSPWDEWEEEGCP